MARPLPLLLVLAAGLHAQPAPRHGGVVLAAGEDYAEVVVHPRGMEVHLVDEWGMGRLGPGTLGAARVKGPDLRRDLRLRPVSGIDGGVTHLAGAAPLGPGPWSVHLALRGVPGVARAVTLQLRELRGEKLAPTPAQLEDYPLATCFMSGQPLGEWGTPVDHLYEGELYRFCCLDCLRRFREDPAAHLRSFREMRDRPARPKRKKRSW